MDLHLWSEQELMIINRVRSVCGDQVSPTDCFAIWNESKVCNIPFEACKKYTEQEYTTEQNMDKTYLRFFDSYLDSILVVDDDLIDITGNDDTVIINLNANHNTMDLVSRGVAEIDLCVWCPKHNNEVAVKSYVVDYLSSIFFTNETNIVQLTYRLK